MKYRFVVAIEAAIDAAQHVIASAWRPRPQDMARFRNLFVHGYARVDDARVVGILRSRVADLDGFRQDVARIA